MAVDPEKHVVHWRSGAESALQSAEVLLQVGQLEHSLFFAHLALEKALKALVTRETSNLAPYTHDLLKLARLAGLDLSPDQEARLIKFNRYCTAGRNEDIASTGTPIDVQLVREEIQTAKEYLACLLQK